MATVNARWLCQPQEVGKFKLPSRSSSARYQVAALQAAAKVRQESPIAARGRERRDMDALTCGHGLPSARQTPEFRQRQRHVQTEESSMLLLADVDTVRKGFLCGRGIVGQRLESDCVGRPE
ncbi:MAG: hypothetical protein JO288_05970 [Hyphomicrobiales bacterium]|nr:hypothetical protein [Hyphomicrobiales bacterium]